jgi:hypothetical protein
MKKVQNLQGPGGCVAANALLSVLNAVSLLLK